MSNVSLIRSETDTAPHSIEAEQQLLGALMVNNDLASTVGAIIQPGDFFDAIHEWSAPPEVVQQLG
jgi:replicative DNA helicase